MAVFKGGESLFDAAQKYAAADREAHAFCETIGNAAKRAACHEKAAEKSKSHRKKLREEIKEQHKKLERAIKKLDDVSERERGRMMIQAGRYIEAWNDFARTGKGAMTAKYDVTGVGALYPNAPKVTWPPYPARN